MDGALLPARAAPLVAMLGAPTDGERLNALSALDRVLEASGLTWTDLAERLRASPEGERNGHPTPYQDVESQLDLLIRILVEVDRGWCAPLNEWQDGFIRDLHKKQSRRKFRWSDKQRAKVIEIADELGVSIT